jgi:hypothetical protein
MQGVKEDLLKFLKHIVKGAMNYPVIIYIFIKGIVGVRNAKEFAQIVILESKKEDNCHAQFKVVLSTIIFNT